MTIIIELFTSNICSRCVQVQEVLRELIDELGQQQFELRLVDVVENIDHAVEVGVLATPALAVNGKLICASISNKCKLRALLREQLAQ